MNGIIIINKPKGYTSQDVVSKTKKILNEKKAGHTGTLDPMATGVLPVLLGEYTKLSKYLIEHDKKYIATVKLGEKRDTGDIEGKIIETKKVDLSVLNEKEIKKVLDEFKGKQKQKPPMYSAIKINGKKLYEYARLGENIDIPYRDIEIYDIKLKDFIIDKFEITFEVSCSKGTYIRVLCENIAEKLNTVGYMSYLNRISVDKFKIENAISFEELEKIKDNNNLLSEKIINMQEVFRAYPCIILNERKRIHFINGVNLTFNFKDGIYNIYTDNKNYIGIGIVKNKLLKRDVVIF